MTMTNDFSDLTPKQIAVLKRQLQVANARLIAIEHEREQMKAHIASLAALLKHVSE